MQGAATYAFVAAVVATSAPVVPPDTSLETFPVAYYGANWNRTDENLEALSKLNVVILMQEDGPCWLKCCPRALEGGNQCGDARGSYHNATALPGCGPECDQHGWQDSVFERLKAKAKRDGRREPHCMLYLNAVYDFPFSSTHRLNDAIDVLDVHGQPHMESVDPGIFPVYMFDYSKEAARKAWLDIVARAVVDGFSDGVYVDCAPTYGLKCDDSTAKCIAKRNGKTISLNEEVSPDQVAAYQQHKDETVIAGSRLVGPNGSYFGNNAGNWATSNPLLGTNTMMMRAPDDVPTLISQVQHALGNYKYLIVGCENCFSNPKTETSALNSRCSESSVAAFLLAVEPGAFLLCNGWDENFGLPLGLPTGPAKQNAKSGVWSRSFAGGTKATWSEGAGTVQWASKPPSFVI